MPAIIKTINSKLERGKIFPLFIPFAGCPFHCIFCAQEKQTGKGKQNIKTALKQAYADFPIFLNTIKAQKNSNTVQSIDIAFYGGTFTAVNEEDFQLCLQFFNQSKILAKQHDIILKGRCSTRPDCLYPDRLQAMKHTGIDLVELGIQSFSNLVLEKSKRGYTGETAINACKTLQHEGFLTGLQLMAGLPEQSEDIFLQDVQTALDLTPSCIRFYPCLVPQNTALATLYEKKEYLPWSNEQCIKTIGQALALAWGKNIPVIRLSVAPEQEFDKSLAAGPRHPSLGSDIMAYSLYKTIQKTLADHPQIQKVILSQNWKGCFLGTKKFLQQNYENLLSPDHFIFTKTDPAQIKFI